MANSGNSNAVSEYIDGTETIGGTLASTGTANISGTLNATGALNISGTPKLTQVTPNIAFQVSGAGNTYKIQSNANPAQNTVVSFVDPGATTCNLMTDNTGGAVVQITNTRTAVTLDKRAGTITMAAAVAANTADPFVFNNTYITATSVVLVSTQNVISGTSFISPTIAVTGIGAGVCTITVTNNDGGHDLSGAAIIQFIVI